MDEYCLKPQYHALKECLNGHPTWEQPPRSSETNIFNPRGKSYKIPAENVGDVLRLQGECAAAHIPTALMEKQSHDSCLFVDADIKFSGPKGCAPDRGGACFGRDQLVAFSNLVCSSMAPLLDLSDIDRVDELCPTVSDPGIVGVVARKPKPKKLREPTATEPGEWRDGLHAYIFIRGDKAMREYVLSAFQATKVIEKTFHRLDTGVEISNPGNTIDMNAAYVPTTLYGACKIGSEPYIAEYCFVMRREAELELGDDGTLRDGGGYRLVAQEHPMPDVRDLAWEMSLNFEMPGGFPKTPVIFAQPALMQMQKIRDRRGLDTAVARTTDEQLQEIEMRDPTFTYWRDILQLITVEKAKYNDWRNVVFALGSMPEGDREDWKVLAKFFSQRAPSLYDEAGFETMWQQATARGRRAGGNAVSWRTILYLAHRDNPIQFKGVCRNSHEGVLTKMAYENNGEISHSDITVLLRQMYGNRYITVKAEHVDLGDRESGGRDAYVWLELGTPGRRANLTVEGDMWKWNVIWGNPDSLMLDIMDELPKMFRRVQEKLKERADTADEDEGKQLGHLIQNFKQSRRQMGNANFVANVIKLARVRFVDYTFASKLDKDPRMLGVANGILEFDDRGGVNFITGMCDAPVSRHSTVEYRDLPYDHPDRARLRQVLSDIFPEGRYDWMMKYASLSLVGGRKTHAFIVFLVGGGNNGKSVFLELLRVLMDQYSFKAPVSLLTSRRESSDGHNSAYACCSGKRYIYFSEPEKSRHNNAVVLEPARLKEMTSPEVQSTRNLRKGQVNFILEGIMMASTNNDFTFSENNYSMWKRAVRIMCNTRFVPNPDPNDPRQKLEDPTISDAYILDPRTRSAFLAELIDHYSDLLRNYGGNIKRVPCDAVHNDTLSYRKMLDKISTFIADCVVERAAGLPSVGHENEPDAGAPDRDMNKPALLDRYREWFAENNAGAAVRNMDSVASELDDAAISRLFYMDEFGIGRYRGLRLLCEDFPTALPGEARIEMALSVPVPSGRTPPIDQTFRANTDHRHQKFGESEFSLDQDRDQDSHHPMGVISPTTRGIEVASPSASPAPSEASDAKDDESSDDDDLEDDDLEDDDEDDDEDDLEDDDDDLEDDDEDEVEDDDDDDDDEDDDED